ncbi:hypothetical protein [Kitasatospora sp. NPDC001132]
MTELELNARLDAALASLSAPPQQPATQLVLEDSWLDRFFVLLGDADGSQAESLLPAWSPQTVALVAEFTARTGGAL